MGTDTVLCKNRCNWMLLPFTNSELVPLGVVKCRMFHWPCVNRLVKMCISKVHILEYPLRVDHYLRASFPILKYRQSNPSRNDSTFEGYVKQYGRISTMQKTAWNFCLFHGLSPQLSGLFLSAPLNSQSYGFGCH
uniref:Uncharacterized protein n=1 Tax=Cacopsylla melanoneura TaxID=428564 RepID=A0A8D8Q758_9HEMI